MSDLQYHDVADFALQSGTVLPVARLAYRTLGALNAARDNAVLVLSGFSGNDDASETALVGRDRAITPDKHFIILANLTGSGRSSSPSNTPAPFDRGRFPAITLYDNVRLQHQLVTEKLGLSSLRMVAGWSMGAAQAYQWGAQFPHMVQAIGAVAGAARTAIYNNIFLYSLRRTLQLDPQFRGGEYDRPPVEGLKAFATIYAGWGLSEPFYRTRAFTSLGANDLDDFVIKFWEPQFLRCDANDLLSQLWSWIHADISANTLYCGNFEAALQAITAKTIILPVDHDRYFPPVDAEYEAARIPNAECRIINSMWGHYAPVNSADTPAIDAALRDLLGA